MSRFVAILVALVVGVFTGEFLSRKAEAHKLAGQIFGRGDLEAMFRRSGIFDREMIADVVLQVSAGPEHLDNTELKRAMFALRGQFGGNRNFTTALRANGMWGWQLREMVADNFRGQEWLEKKIASQIYVSSDEARRYFDQHQTDFAQPLRLRPRHIFLAAPQGSDVIEGKRAAMEEIVARLNAGEDFASLAAEVSEDEATRFNGGDLGFLGRDRVPLEFWSAIENLPVNGPVARVQSHLGFHAGQILEVRPARTMTFEEARPEIRQILAGEKRRAAVAQLHDQLAQQAVLVSQ